MYNEIIEDTIKAGLLLSEKLKKYQKSNTVILAVPRGGVPVGCILAKKTQLPLDSVRSKKAEHPHNKEFAIGAISVDSIRIDEHPEVPQHYIADKIVRLRKAIDEIHKRYIDNRKPLLIENKNMIIVGKRITTAHTLLVCIIMLRKKNTAELVSLIAVKKFRGVREFYKSFEQVEDQDAIRTLNT